MKLVPFTQKCCIILLFFVILEGPTECHVTMIMNLYSAYLLCNDFTQHWGCVTLFNKKLQL